MKKTITFFNPYEPAHTDKDSVGILVSNSNPKRKLSQAGFILWFVILTLVFIPLNIAFGRSLGELMRNISVAETTFYSSLTFLVPTIIAFVYLILATFVAGRRKWALRKKGKWLWALPILDLLVFDIIVIKWLYAGFSLTWLVAVWPVLVAISILASLALAFKKDKRTKK